MKLSGLLGSADDQLLLLLMGNGFVSESHEWDQSDILLGLHRGLGTLPEQVNRGCGQGGHSWSGRLTFVH